MAAALDHEPRTPIGFLAVLGGALHREPRQRDPSSAAATRFGAGHIRIIARPFAG